MPVHIKEQLAWHAWNYRCPRCRGRGWCGCSKQNPPIRHHTRTMGLSALHVSQQHGDPTRTTIKAQQSITNKAGRRSLCHGKVARIFFKERPSQRQSKHRETRTIVSAALFEMFESLPLNKAQNWCHGNFIPAFKETLDIKPWGRC